MAFIQKHNWSRQKQSYLRLLQMLAALQSTAGPLFEDGCVVILYYSTLAVGLMLQQSGECASRAFVPSCVLHTHSLNTSFQTTWLNLTLLLQSTLCSPVCQKHVIIMHLFPGGICHSKAVKDKLDNAVNKTKQKQCSDQWLLKMWVQCSSEINSIECVVRRSSVLSAVGGRGGVLRRKDKD